VLHGTFLNMGFLPSIREAISLKAALEGAHRALDRSLD
jgi:hypothetical protein